LYKVHKKEKKNSPFITSHNPDTSPLGLDFGCSLFSNRNRCFLNEQTLDHFPEDISSPLIFAMFENRAEILSASPTIPTEAQLWIDSEIVKN